MDCYSKIYDWDILFEANFNIRIDQFITFRIVERNVGVVDVTRNSCIKYKYMDNEYNIEYSFVYYSNIGIGIIAFHTRQS